MAKTLLVKYDKTKEARFDFIHRLVARAFRTNEILTVCSSHPLFRYRRKQGGRPTAGLMKRKGKGRKEPNPRYISGDAIRGIIAQVRKQIREQHLDYDIELREGFERLIEAYRTAVDSGDAKGMVQAQRELNTMLGIKNALSARGPDIDLIRTQMIAMLASVPGKKGSMV